MPIDFEKLGVFYLGTELSSESLSQTEDLYLYDAKDLTTHAVCVGMTGSGKTGLCIDLLEEAAIDGIPVIAIDPKGDIANLALQFSNASALDFKNWITDSSQSPESVATAYQSGLAASFQKPDRIDLLKKSADVVIYTPKSKSGKSLSFLKNFAAPSSEVLSQEEAYNELLQSTTVSIFSLLGEKNIDLTEPRFVLITKLFDFFWQQGKECSIETLISALSNPPISKVGVMTLDDFFPKAERNKLALSLNAMISSSSFSLWNQGEALNVQNLLWNEKGKAQVSVIYIAHLQESERMFVVTHLLNEILTWARKQSGTQSLRALLFMDEIFGYFPPISNPPSKLPLLTLMKQARAYGLGLVLATQNPVDLDYKGLSNAGTWFVGRLQTEQDRERLIEGLMQTGANLNKSEIATQLAQLPKRTFWVRNIHESKPAILQTRYALSYLAGPLTLAQVEKLSGGSKTETAKTQVKSHTSLSQSNVLPSFLKPTMFTIGQGDASIMQPYLLGTARIFLKHKDSNGTWEKKFTAIAPVSEDCDDPWEFARELDASKLNATKPEHFQGSSVSICKKLESKTTFESWIKFFTNYIQRSAQANVYFNDEFDIVSKPEETESEVRARLSLAIREKRDEAVLKLRGKYQSKIEALEVKLARAQKNLDEQQAQATQSGLQTAINLGATILGAVLGGKRRSGLGSLQRASSTIGRANRTLKERGDVKRVSEGIEDLEADLKDLQDQCETEVNELSSRLDASNIELQKQVLRPNKQDITILDVSFAWIGEVS